MRPITRRYSAVGEEVIPLNIHNIDQQIQIQTNWINGGAGTFTLQGNIGMRDDTIAPGATGVQSGYTVPNPDGWYDIQATGGADVRLSNDDLKDFMPMAFVKVIVNTLTAGELMVNVLQQSLR